MSREHLLQATRIHEEVFDHSIDVQILRLGRKHETDPNASRIIQTVLSRLAPYWRGCQYEITFPMIDLGRGLIAMDCMDLWLDDGN